MAQGVKRVASYWRKLADGRVKCTLCPRHCALKSGELAYCGVRRNDGGTLYTLIFGHPSSVNVDPIEKKPLYHFWPGSRTLSLGTVGCNLRCAHCQNWQLSFADADDSTIAPRELKPEVILDMLDETRSQGISFTYNEPTIWHEYAMDVFPLVRAKGYYTSYITNGVIDPEPLRELAGVLDAYRCDLKTLSNKTFFKLARYNRPKVVLDSMVIAKEAGVHVEVVTNVIPTYNDGEVGEMAKWIRGNLGEDTAYHITRYFPQPGFDVPATPVPMLERCLSDARSAGLNYVYLGNMQHRSGSTFCKKCGETIVERNGYDTRVVAPLDVCRKCGTRLPFVAPGLKVDSAPGDAQTGGAEPR
jgi:pyruvate formate lyase activating enzyme